MALTLLHSKTVSAYLFPPSFCCRQRSSQVEKHSQLAAALPLLRTTSSGYRTTSNLLNILWQQPASSSNPFQGPEIIPRNPKNSTAASRII